MKSSKTILLSVVVFVLIVGIFLVGDQIAKRNIRRTDFGPLTDLFVGRLGEMLTVPIPEPHQSDARLLTTYQRAAEVVEAIDPSTRKILPKATTDLSAISANDKLDGWGNPYCLVVIRDRIAAVSSGPGQHERLDCADLRLDLRRIADEPSGKLYRYPTGELVYLSGQGSQPSALRSDTHGISAKPNG
jgi:hypothetical protein